MGKILATWLVKLTLRAPDDADEATLATAAEYVPTNDQVATWVGTLIVDEINETDGPALEANATAERTDI